MHRNASNEINRSNLITMSHFDGYDKLSLLISLCFHPGWCDSCKHSFATVRWYQYFAMVMFVWASWHQWKCHVILATLRRSPSGQIIKVYRIPYGDWFEFVSSPHYLAEIVIYLSLFILQKACNIYFGLILLFTIQNLTIGATVAHGWYKNKFNEYPNSRYRIFPFIYWLMW